MLLLDFSHTLSNNNFNSIADLSVLVKDLITQLWTIGPSIQVYVADSVLSSSSQSLHIFVTISRASSYILRFWNSSQKRHEANLHNEATLPPDTNVNIEQTLDYI